MSTKLPYAGTTTRFYFSYKASTPATVAKQSKIAKKHVVGMLLFLLLLTMPPNSGTEKAPDEKHFFSDVLKFYGSTRPAVVLGPGGDHLHNYSFGNVAVSQLCSRNKLELEERDQQVHVSPKYKDYIHLVILQTLVTFITSWKNPL